MDFLSKKELSKFGKVGKNVLISKHAIFYGKENIFIGSDVRIDALNVFMASKGCITIGNRVHIAVGSRFLGGGTIDIEHGAQIAFNCSLISASDDFSGEHLVGPMFPEDVRKVYSNKIYVGYLAVIGAGCVLSPGTFMENGSALASMSFTKADQRLNTNTIYAGIPAKVMKPRSDLQYRLLSRVPAYSRSPSEEPYTLRTRIAASIRRLLSFF